MMQSMTIKTKSSHDKEMNFFRCDLGAVRLRLLEYDDALALRKHLARLKMFGSAFCKRDED
jgi:hypothetical protein